ncbi:MAG: hypothetical protein HKP23_07000 [Flavobacteriaceae bacterium]|nr:hypothetical protein [Eudoraea sp.]NNJ38970.1 hypothetical protein [Flavobacteriaceae bacterium]
MIRKSFTFLAQLVIILVFVGLLHYAVIYAREWAIVLPDMGLAYLLNLLLAVGIYIAMLQFAAQQSSYLGFLFLFGSVLKFAAYFVILEPVFKRDGSLSKIEFFYFFIPYLSCLIAETFALVKLLRENDPSRNS